MNHLGKKNSTFGNYLLYLGEKFLFAAHACRISSCERNDMRFNIYTLRTAVLFLFLIQLQGCAFSQADQTVYITRTGNKYHTGTCQYLKHSRIGVRLSVAKEQGYTACSACHSSGVKNPAEPVTPRQQKQSQPMQQVHHSTAEKTVTISRQCIAKTKAGSRCKRTARNANGKCWQHQ